MRLHGHARFCTCMQDALKRPSVTSEARRRQILDAAVATIAADGLAKASFSAIAERAGLSSVGLISYHFAGRDELIGQIVADYYASITAHMQDRMAGISSPTAALEAYISGVIDYIGAHPAQMKALTEVFLQGAMNHGRVEEDAATGPRRGHPAGGAASRRVPPVRRTDHGRADPTSGGRVALPVGVPARARTALVRPELCDRGGGCVPVGDPERTAAMTGAPSAGRARPTTLLAGMAVDLVLPVIVYYGLRSVGVAPMPALLASALPPLVSVVVTAVRGRRPDGLGLVVAASVLVGALLSGTSGDPRALLMRDGWLTGAWSVVFLVGLRWGRPLTFTLARPLLEGRRIWDPRGGGLRAPRPESWDEVDVTEPRFRRIWRVTAVIWATAFAVDAGLRIAMATALPVDVVPALSAALWPVTLVLLQVVTNVYLAVAGFWRILLAEQKSAAAAA